MLTRREFIVGAVAAGVILRTQTAFSKAPQPATKVNFDGVGVRSGYSQEDLG